MTKTSNRSPAHKVAKAKTVSPSVKTEKKAGKRSTVAEKKPQTRKLKNKPPQKVSSVKTPSVKTEKKASSPTVNQSQSLSRRSLKKEKRRKPKLIMVKLKMMDRLFVVGLERALPSVKSPINPVSWKQSKNVIITSASRIHNPLFVMWLNIKRKNF
jgi:uncharacterized membrane protein